MVMVISTIQILMTMAMARPPLVKTPTAMAIPPMTTPMAMAFPTISTPMTMALVLAAVTAMHDVSNAPADRPARHWRWRPIHNDPDHNTLAQYLTIQAGVDVSGVWLQWTTGFEVDNLAFTSIARSVVNGCK